MYTGNLSTMQDTELVTLFKEGSQQAFEVLYLRYIKKLTFYCNNLLRDEIRAEDVAHDVFLQVLEMCDSLNPEKSFHKYIQTIAHNRIINEFKSTEIHLRYAQHTIMNENAAQQTENTVIDNDYANLLNRMIDGLTPQQKEVFRLSRIQGLTYNEIAELLHITLRTVKKHASLALGKFKKQLNEHADIYFKTVTAFLIVFS